MPRGVVNVVGVVVEFSKSRWRPEGVRVVGYGMFFFREMGGVGVGFGDCSLLLLCDLYLVVRDLLLDRFGLLDPTEPSVVLGPLGAVIGLATASATTLGTTSGRGLLRTGVARCHH